VLVFILGSAMIRVPFVLGSEYFLKIRFMFDSSYVNLGFGFGLVRVLHRCNWKDVSMVVICYGLTVIVSTN